MTTLNHSGKAIEHIRFNLVSGHYKIAEIVHGAGNDTQESIKFDHAAKRVEFNESREGIPLVATYFYNEAQDLNKLVHFQRGYVYVSELH